MNTVCGNAKRVETGLFMNVRAVCCWVTSNDLKSVVRIHLSALFLGQHQPVVLLSVV